MKMLFAIITWLIAGAVMLVAAPTDVHHYTVGDGLTTDEVRQLIELPNGQLLVNAEGTFALFDGLRFREVPCDANHMYKLKNHIGYAHLWQGDSLLWLRNFYYLYLFDARARAFRCDIKERLTDAYLVAFAEEEAVNTNHEVQWQPWLDSIHKGMRPACALTDRQGGHWIGTRNDGLYYFRPQRPQATFIGRNDSLNTLARSMKDSQGRRWSCGNDGLNCYTDGRTVHYGKENIGGLLHDRMLFITELGDGRYLLCNHMHYFGYFWPDELRFEPLNPKLPELDNYRVGIGAVTLPDKHLVLVYTQNGAFLLDTKADSIVPFPASDIIARQTEKYNCALVDRRGNLWLGTQRGLYQIKNETLALEGRFQSESGKESKIKNEGGGEGEVEYIRGLSNSCIRSLVEDWEGNIWVGTSAGISRISPDLLVMNFGPADGVPQTSMAERSACMTDDGRLVFVQHTMGLTVFRPEWFGNDTAQQQVRLVGFEVNGIPASPDARLTYRDNYLLMRLSALNYAAPDHTRYRYRLVGIDRDWQLVTNGSGLCEARYSALPHGRYTLEAQAATDTGQWGETLCVSFRILPPWWLTWWAKGIMVLMGVMVLMGLTGFYLRRKKARLIAENDERVNRLFELREEARHQFAEQVSIDASKITANSEEEQLVESMLQAIERNMDNAEYTVDQLAQDVCMSRSNLYRKTQTMLGITPNDFLRNVRLKRAAQLLSKTNLPINQIAERVGFNTPRYFSQYFKQMFGVLPSEYRSVK